MKVRCLASLIAVSAFLVVAAAQPVYLVRNMQATSEIVVPLRANPAQTLAAYELQTGIGQLTGAFVPITTTPTEGIATRLYIGRSFAKRLFRKDIGAIGRSDGFAVRSAQEADAATGIYLFGAVPRGTLHSIYAFLERNSDIVWARPEMPLGTIYSHHDSLIASHRDFTEIPKTNLRGWQWTTHSATEETPWQSRNRMNRIGGGPEYASMFVKAGAGHGLKLFIDPKTYFESHPEYYPLIDGKRARTGQLCFCAIEMIPEYVKNIREYLAAQYPKTRPDRLHVDYLNVSVTDGWGLCTCERCLAPFKTGSGQIVASDDPAFRSAQYYTFINKVARELKKTHPKVTLGIYAYIFAAPPPPFPLEDNIRVQYCPFVRNDKAPIFDDVTNRNWHEYLDKWGASGNKTWVRDYWGWANTFPRALEYTVQKDLQYYLRHNVRELSAEHPVDKESKVWAPSKEVWDVSGMTAWLISRLWWNPDQDIEKLRDFYMLRVYREAAPAMRKYHDLIRDSWYANSFPSMYSDSVLPMVSTYIVKAGIKANCRAALVEALDTVKHPKSRELIARQLKHFDNWMEQVKDDKTVRMDVPHCAATGIANAFKSPIWEKAGQTGAFVVADKQKRGQKALIRSEARLLHDRKNLYVYYDCHASDMATLEANVGTHDGTEMIPRGDIMEFFLGDPNTGVYYQFMFDVGNGDGPAKDVVYDAKGHDPAWTCEWKRNIRRYEDKWCAIVRIPLEGIGVNITQNNKLLFLPVRGKYYDSKDAKTGKTIRTREMASWGGGWVHQMSGFGEITLLQN